MSSKLPLKYFISKNKVVKHKSFKHLANKKHLYQKEAAIEFPLIPLWPFGLRFEDDICLCLDGDGPWAMIEIACAKGPNEQELWFVLDSYLDGTQVVGLPKENYQQALEWAQFFPAQTYDSQLTVEKKIEGSKEWLSFSYQRFDDEKISFEIEIDRSKTTTPLFRNGNTMNHSEKTAQVGLDLESMQLISAKKIKFHTAAKKIQKILVVSLSLRLTQVVAGFRIGQWQQREGKVCYNDQMTVITSESEEEITIQTPITQHWKFKDNDGKKEFYALELSDQKTQLSRFSFYPPLPDLRYLKVEQEYHVKMLGDINQQEGFILSNLTISKNKEGDISFILRGERPHWVKNRPLKIEGRYISPNQFSWSCERISML